MILRRPPRDPDVEILDDADVRARVEAGQLVQLRGCTPVDKAKVQTLRRWIRQRDAERRARRTGKERAR